MSTLVDPVWVGAAGLLSSVGTFFAGQRHGKAEFITAVSKAADLVIVRLQSECERMEDAREKCEAGHAECQRQVSTLELQVRALMSGEAATYSPTDLRRVSQPKA